MNLLSYPRTIEDILTLNRKYTIPRFQRDYAWEEDEHEVFWEDIFKKISINEEKLTISEYFIGALVLVGNDSSDSVFEIVDGQQRLTTITIIFSALTHIFNEMNEKALANSCYSYVEGKDRDYIPFFKLQNENPKPFFQQRIQNKTIQKKYIPNNEEEERLLNAYKFYIQKLKKENLEKIFGDTVEYKKVLKAIRDQILKFKTIFITVDLKDEAYTIFETLNAKGKDLETIDLIKNKIFKVLNNEHPSDEAKEKWKNIKKILKSRENSENLSVFFRHFWISKYKFLTESKLYESFLKMVQDSSEEYKSFLNELEKEVNNYLLITNPLDTDWKQQEEKDVYQSLRALNLFGIIQARTIILGLINVKERKLININEFTNIIKIIEKFHFIFTAICSSRPSGLEQKYSTIARKLRKEQTKESIREIVKELKDYYNNKKPEYEIFESEFKEIKFTNKNNSKKKLIQYIFCEIEKNSHPTDELIPYNISLEHILPQSEEVINIGVLGNILPLSREINSNVKNKRLKEKILFFKNSELKLVKEFVEKNKGKELWTLNDIETRTKELAKKAYYEVWQF